MQDSQRLVFRTPSSTTQAYTPHTMTFTDFANTVLTQNYAIYEAIPIPDIATKAPTNTPYAVGVTMFQASADTIRHTVFPTRNYGDGNLLFVTEDSKEDALIYFPVAETPEPGQPLNPNDLPSGAVVTHASLNLQVKESIKQTPAATPNQFDYPVGVFGVTQSWKEMEATWQNSMIGTPWESPGRGYAAATVWASFQSPRAGNGYRTRQSQGSGN